MRQAVTLLAVMVYVGSSPTRLTNYADVAQRPEQPAPTRRAGGSTPSIRANQEMKMAEKWMQEAFSKNKGKLHRALGVPEDQKIPAGKLSSEKERLQVKAKRLGKLSKTDLTRLREVMAAIQGRK
jgi:hypothetical protein